MRSVLVLSALALTAGAAHAQTAGGRTILTWPGKVEPIAAPLPSPEPAPLMEEAPEPGPAPDAAPLPPLLQPAPVAQAAPLPPLLQPQPAVLQPSSLTRSVPRAGDRYGPARPPMAPLASLTPPARAFVPAPVQTTEEAPAPEAAPQAAPAQSAPPAPASIYTPPPPPAADQAAEAPSQAAAAAETRAEAAPAPATAAPVQAAAAPQAAPTQTAAAPQAAPAQSAAAAPEAQPAQVAAAPVRRGWSPRPGEGAGAAPRVYSVQRETYVSPLMTPRAAPAEIAQAPAEVAQAPAAPEQPAAPDQGGDYAEAEDEGLAPAATSSAPRPPSYYQRWAASQGQPGAR